ncbi:MAG: H-NS histone family protein [Thiothrix sp.]|nr:H-NS histone family protein [Thiothrix sp.]HPQ97526.1 H-NS histone family protein [Thiolinea sp.]
MASINLEELTVAELDRLKNSIDSAIVNRRQSELMNIRRQVDEIVGTSGFSLQEILDARPARKPVEPKYQNPDNLDETWTGRGRRPRWVESCIKSGKTLEELAI